MERNSAGLYLSVITIAEVEDGIARSRRAGAHAKASRSYSRHGRDSTTGVA